MTAAILLPEIQALKYRHQVQQHLAGDALSPPVA
jgi:hypothetical protein